MAFANANPSILNFNFNSFTVPFQVNYLQSGGQSCQENPISLSTVIANTTCLDTSCRIVIDEITADEEVCAGDNDGEITITATGTNLTGSLEYSIDGVTFQSSNMFTGLSSGSTPVTVRDAMDTDCMVEQVFVLSPGQSITEPGDREFTAECDEENTTLVSFDCTDSCPGGGLATVNWYSSATSTSVLATGTTFEIGSAPGTTAAGVTSFSTSSNRDFTYFVECACDPCSSERSEVVVTVEGCECGFTFDITTRVVCDEYFIELTNIVGIGDAAGNGFQIVLNGNAVASGSGSTASISTGLTADGTTLSTIDLIPLGLAPGIVCDMPATSITAPGPDLPNLPQIVPNSSTTRN